MTRSGDVHPANIYRLSPSDDPEDDELLKINIEDYKDSPKSLQKIVTFYNKLKSDRNERDQLNKKIDELKAQILGKGYEGLASEPNEQALALIETVSYGITRSDTEHYKELKAKTEDFVKRMDDDIKYIEENLGLFDQIEPETAETYKDKINLDKMKSGVDETKNKMLAKRDHYQTFLKSLKEGDEKEKKRSEFEQRFVQNNIYVDFRGAKESPIQEQILIDKVTELIDQLRENGKDDEVHDLKKEVPSFLSDEGKKYFEDHESDLEPEQTDPNVQAAKEELKKYMDRFNPWAGKIERSATTKNAIRIAKGFYEEEFPKIYSATIKALNEFDKTKNIETLEKLRKEHNFVVDEGMSYDARTRSKAFINLVIEPLLHRAKSQKNKEKRCKS